MPTNCLISRWCFSLSLFLSSTQSYADGAAIRRVLYQQATLSGFEVCHGGGCAVVDRVALDEEEWQQAVAAFVPLPQNAEDERRCIAAAIGSLERIIGAKTATATDRGGTFGNADYPGQLDCNDEAANSTTYLKLLQQAGHIRHHEIIDIKVRGFFFNGWPHTTAAIREVQSGQRYAVDSWFYDNGVPAVIVPLETWKAGWRPKDSAAR